MNESAITNSACLIVLERIGRGYLLSALLNPLVVTPKVHEEFGIALYWLQVKAPANAGLSQL